MSALPKKIRRINANGVNKKEVKERKGSPSDAYINNAWIKTFHNLKIKA